MTKRRARVSKVRPSREARERRRAPARESGSRGGAGRKRDRLAAPQRAWSQILGEVVLIGLVIAVPLVITPRTLNAIEVKDVVLGLGVALGLGVWLLAGLAEGRLGWVRSHLVLAAIGFVVWAGISVFYARYKYVSVSEFGRLAAHLGLVFLVIGSLRTGAQVKRLIGAACLASVPVSIYAFKQAAGQDFISWTAQVTRVFSFLGNPTYLGGYLILLIPLAVAAGWPEFGERSEAQSRRGKRPGFGSLLPLLQSAFFFSAAIMMALSLYFSYTLSGVIGLGLGAPIALALVLVRGGRQAARVALPGALAAAVVLGCVGWIAYHRMPRRQRERVDTVLRFQDPYAQERQLHWRTVQDLFREAPVLGNGYGSFRVTSLERMASEWYLQAAGRRQGMLVPGYAHNEYLQVLADTGVIGGALFFVMLGLGCGLAGWVSLRAEQAIWRRLGLGITVAFIAFLFQNFFGVTFRQTGAVTLFWLWVGLLALAAAWLPQSGQSVEAPRVREFRFRPPSLAGMALAATSLAVVLAILAWVTIRPVIASFLVRRAEAAAGRGHLEVAVASAEEAVEICPYSFRGYYNMAYAQGLLGQFEKAARANERALELLPGNASVYYNLGVSYKELKRFSEAEANFREAVRLMPTAALMQAAVAEVLLEQDRFEEALPYVQRAAELEPGNAKIYVLLAELYGKCGDTPKTVANLEKAVRLRPTDASLCRRIAELYFSMGRFEEGLEACQKWVTLDPKAEAYMRVADLLLAHGRSEEALPYAQRAAQLDPQEEKAYLLLAELYRRRRDIPKTVANLGKAARLKPTDAELHQKIAGLYLSMGRFEEGLKACRKWVALDPTAAAHYAQGFAEYSLGRYPEAKASFLQALKLDPRHAAARLNLGYTLARLKDGKGATEELERVAREFPNTREGREARKTLDKAQRRAEEARRRAAAPVGRPAASG